MNPFHVLGLLAEGINEKGRVDTFGPDYRQRNAHADIENAISATKYKESQRAEAAEIRAALDAYPGERDPDEAISKLRSSRASSKESLERRLTESQIGENEAQADYQRARPGMEQSKAERDQQHRELMEQLAITRAEAATHKPQSEPGTYIPMVRNGVMGAWNPKTNRWVEAPDGSRPKPSAGQVDAMDEGANLLSIIGNIKRGYRSDWVGPGTARLYNAGNRVPGLGGLLGYAKEDLAPNAPRSSFVSDVASLGNKAIKATTGAQMSEQEVPRLFREIPADTDPSPTFEAKLATFERRIQVLQAVKEGRISREQAVQVIESDDPTRPEVARQVPPGAPGAAGGQMVKYQGKLVPLSSLPPELQRRALGR